ncbi:MAG: hypothetical protein ACR2PI_03360 [Hyphomicrobiaceae bacterium]
MELAHLSWPFFEAAHHQIAAEFDQWASTHLTEFEQDEGGDGRAARRIFELMAAQAGSRTHWQTVTRLLDDRI